MTQMNCLINTYRKAEKMYIKIKRLVGILLAMAMVLTYIGAMPALATNGLVLQSGNQSNNNTGGVSPQTGEVIRIGSLILFNNMLMEHYQYSQANTKRYADAINQLYQVCEGIDTYVVTMQANCICLKRGANI